MAQDMDEAEALRAEVAELRAEVERLRAFTNPPTGSGVWLPASLPCSCGTTGGCQAHPRPWPGNVWINAAANGCAAGFAGQVCQLDLSHSMKIESWLYNSTGCAAAAVPQTLVFNTAGGQ